MYIKKNHIKKNIYKKYENIKIKNSCNDSYNESDFILEVYEEKNKIIKKRNGFLFKIFFYLYNIIDFFSINYKIKDNIYQINKLTDDYILNFIENIPQISEFNRILNGGKIKIESLNYILQKEDLMIILKEKGFYKNNDIRNLIERIKKIEISNRDLLMFDDIEKNRYRSLQFLNNFLDL